MDTGALDPRFFTRKEHRKVQPVLPHCCGDVPVPIAKTCGRHLAWREGVCSGDYVRDPEMGSLRCVIWGEDLACVSPSFSHPHSSSLPGMSLSRGWGGGGKLGRLADSEAGFLTSFALSETSALPSPALFLPGCPSPSPGLSGTGGPGPEGGPWSPGSSHLAVRQR